jgi:hypothetical protein
MTLLTYLEKNENGGAGLEGAGDAGDESRAPLGEEVRQLEVGDEETEAAAGVEDHGHEEVEEGRTCRSEGVRSWDGQQI